MHAVIIPPCEGQSVCQLPQGWPPAPVPTAATPPVLTSLVPNTAPSGSPPFMLHIKGSDFACNAVIMFGGGSEPSRINEKTEVGTIVIPELFAPAVVPVRVMVPGVGISNTLNFTFT